MSAPAAAYERLLRGEIFSGIIQRGIPGFRTIELCRRAVPDGVEFLDGNMKEWFETA